MAETIINDVFGRLTWDAYVLCWQGELSWPDGTDTKVSIFQEDDEDVAAALRRARDSLDWLQSHERHVRWCIAWALLEVYNDSWRKDPEPLTADEFVRRLSLRLTAAGFMQDGSLLLTYVDPELFPRRDIAADFEPDRSFSEAQLYGPGE